MPAKKNNIFIKLFIIFSLALIFFSARNAVAFSDGETKKFFVDPTYDYANRKNISATLRYAGDWSLIYVEDDYWYGLKDTIELQKIIAALKEEFDKNIHPRLTQIFGFEWSPGIDNEYRITILITKMKEGAGGYFNSADEYSFSQIATSNEREMIYLNSTYLNLNLDRAKGFLAHEFQHMITFYQKTKKYGLAEDTWLNEARSEYVPTLLGYDDIYQGSNLERRVSEFLRDPTDSLTEWKNETLDYGPVNLFMQYLASRYGNLFLTKMMYSSSVGIPSVEEALSSLGLKEKFADVFLNWQIANFINDCQVGDGQKFCYLTNRLPHALFHVNPLTSNLLEASEGASFFYTDDIKEWSGHWYQILPKGNGLNLVINFSGNPLYVWKVAVILYNSDGTKTVRYLNLMNQVGSDIVLNFGGQVKSVLIVPASVLKITSFSANEPMQSFSYGVKMTSANQVLSPQPIVTPTPAPPAGGGEVAGVIIPEYPDGSLIRATQDPRVYQIKGKYKRWIQSPEIFAVNPFFSWQNVIEVASQQCDWYFDAWLIRAEDDYKVYEINGDLSKHWLNISPEQFMLSGRKWEMVFVVNKAERDLYQTGAMVLK